MSKTKTILVIEDDNFLQGLEAQKLKKEGYEVLTAGDSVEAFDALEKNYDKINLVLLDLLLPEVDGFYILKKIRDDEKLKHLPVLVFSNLSEEKDIERASKLGIIDFLIKSNFTLDELAQKIKNLLQK